MTITVTTIANSQSFGAWLSTTNRLANIVSQNTVTVDTSSGGSLSTGNGYVNGYFGANYLYVANGLSGGNVSSNGVLNVVSNAAFKYSTSNLMTLTANTSESVLTVNVNIINITANTISITGNTTFANAVTFTNTVFWNSTETPIFSANVIVNNSITVGNSTVNAVINSTSLALSNSTVSYVFASPNSAQYAANNYYLNANGQWAAVVAVTPNGSNTQVQFNDSSAFGGSSGLTFNKLSNTLTVGTVTVNSTVINSTSYIIGSSFISNTSGVYTNGTVNAASLTTSGVTTNTSGVYPATNSSGTALGGSTQRWNITANTINTSGTLTIGTGGGLNANGSVGTNGDALFSNGSSVYWSKVKPSTSVITANTTAVAGTNYYLNAAAVKLTLPASPSVGDEVGISEVAGNYNCSIGRNSSNIMGLSSDLSLDRAYIAFKLTYVDSTLGWVFS